MQDAALGDDGGDVASRRDVEGGITDIDSVGRELASAVVRDFDGGALLDGDGIAGGGGEVDGGPGRGDVERDSVFAGKDGDAVGSDLVGNVAVGGDAVGTDDDGLDATLTHEAPGHVVAKDGGGDAVGHQFPCGEAGSLKEGTSFVGEDVDFLTALDGSANDAQGSAIATGGQRAGVAVGEHGALVGHEIGTEGSHGAAGSDVFVVHGASFCFQARANIGHAAASGEQLGKDALHPVDGPEEIDGGGTRAGEQIAACGKGLGKRLCRGGRGGFCGQRESHGRADADGRRAADDHGGDDGGDLLWSGGEQVGFFKGQFGLVEEPDAFEGPFKGRNHQE